MEQEYHILCKLTEALQGRIIDKVEYFDYFSEEINPSWSIQGKEFHYLDFGLDLHIGSGDIISITWSNLFGGYGIEISEQSLSSSITSYSKWNVSHNLFWNLSIGSPIKEIRVYWAQSPNAASEIPFICPHTLEITFGNAQKIYFVAAQYVEEGDVFLLMTDDVAVIFSEKIAEHYGIGPFNKNNTAPVL